MPVISLTGFMGSGKTSVGKELAILLDWDFFDLDAMIVERDGRAVSRIFAEDGEQAFRETESAVLRHFFRYRNSPVYHICRRLSKPSWTIFPTISAAGPCSAGAGACAKG